MLALATWSRCASAGPSRPPAALFHVIAYVLDEEALARVFATVRAHLDPGGLFFFDTWSACAVEATPPEPRQRIIVQGGREVVRRATPIRRGATVEVIFEFDVDGERFSELHVLRPRDEAALTEALQRNGFLTLAARASLDSYDLRMHARAI